MVYVPRMLSQRWNSFRVCLVYFEWWFWNGLWFPLMLSMREYQWLVGGACAKIGYSLAEHTRKSRIRSRIRILTNMSRIRNTLWLCSFKHFLIWFSEQNINMADSIPLPASWILKICLWQCFRIRIGSWFNQVSESTRAKIIKKWPTKIEKS